MLVKLFRSRAKCPGSRWVRLARDELPPHELGLEVRWKEPEKGLAVAGVEVCQAALVRGRHLVGMGRAVDEG